jgi:hypothetical protein
VGEDVGVRVADQSPLEGYLHPAEDEPACGAFFREGMSIDA